MNKAKLIMGSAIGLAAVAVAIDHTRHRLPEPVITRGIPQNAIILESPDERGSTPCGLRPAEPPPCALTPTAPCSL